MEKLNLLSYDGGQVKAVDSLFGPADKSPVGLVRIAAHIHEITKCQEAGKRLKELGYTVAFNLMQSSLASDETLSEIARTVSDWGSLSVLYFADSLGNMGDEDVARIVNAFRNGWDGPIGFHAHNNMGRGMANDMAAIGHDVSWIDATIRGIGRGAGNTPMEYLLIELETRGIHDCHPDAIFELAAREFTELQKQYEWGSNLFYYLAGVNSVHPTYVQEMLLTERYSTDDIITVIKGLGGKEARSYSAISMQNAIASSYTKGDGGWSAKNWAKDRTVLLIAAGEQARRHRNAIIGFIEKTGPIVIL